MLRQGHRPIILKIYISQQNKPPETWFLQVFFPIRQMCQCFFPFYFYFKKNGGSASSFILRKISACLPFQPIRVCSRPFSWRMWFFLPLGAYALLLCTLICALRCVHSNRDNIMSCVYWEMREQWAHTVRICYVQVAVHLSSCPSPFSCILSSNICPPKPMLSNQYADSQQKKMHAHAICHSQKTELAKKLELLLILRIPLCAQNKIKRAESRRFPSQKLIHC